MIFTRFSYIIAYGCIININTQSLSLSLVASLYNSMAALCLASRNLLIKKKQTENMLHTSELSKTAEYDISKIESTVLISQN